MTNNSGSRLWPVHIKPKNDELLSSWLVRLAMSHGLKLHTFCSIALPLKQIWTRDIDKAPDTEVLQILSDKTGTPFRQVFNTTLMAYENVLFQRCTRYGPNSWIMPVGVYHRTRTRFGLQICPKCLVEDKEPYYRKKWRLAFIVLCNKHNTLLIDRCPRCKTAINFHRDELGDFRKFVSISMTHCYVCKFDLRETIVEEEVSYPVLESEVRSTTRLLQAVNNGYIYVNGKTQTYSLFYFTVLRQMMKVLAMKNSRLDKLRNYMRDTCGIGVYVPTKREQPDLQEQDTQTRRQLLIMALWLLEDWPDRFISLSQRFGIWSSIWLRHLESGSRSRSQPAPFWFWRVVHNYLYRARYQPSDEEIASAIKFARQFKIPLNRSSLSRLLGLTISRRDSLVNSEPVF